jgi:predicted helicase
MLNKYLEALFKTTKLGDAREESYYPDLKSLLEVQNKDLSVTVLPKKTEGGNPDFRVWDGKDKIVGYIEAKDPKIDDLGSIEDTEQLRRYLNTFPNLILTNFFEFRLYRNGELIDKVQVGQPFVIHKLQMVPPAENEEKFKTLLNKFLSFSLPKTTTARSLATELAKRTRFLRDNVISEELKEEKISGTQKLESFYKAFKEHLIPSLTLQEFSDIFAQTIAYGLFAARTRADNEFNRELAYKFIPTTIGILRDVFRFISSTDIPQSMVWIIDDIAEVLKNAHVKEIMENFYKEGKGKDPVIHFYETFLAEYDLKEREKRGVYYTPEPVVGYIVRSIHKLLKEKFGKEDGFATQSVTVLDPASGTLTFPAEAIRLAIEESKRKYGEGSVSSLIKDHILKNFYAFELMMAPYAIGHLKIGFLLDEYGYKLSENERFNLFLTNTLDFTKEDPNKFPGVFEQAITKESQDALKVKEEIPIMVVMGNPPYSGSSENKGQWILDQINEYKKVNGEPLGEKNPKWLQDDYVKFLRFAQWKIEKSGGGILGFITNHAWLDNPTFRGMRSSILNTFDEIYILNLHGNTLKKEKTPEGGKDENVFDIQPGVAITIAIKNNDLEKKKVFYADKYGLREEKYDWLDEKDIKSTNWLNINPTNPHYFLISKDEKSLAHYQSFTKITDIFPVNSVGVVTGRDEFVIDFDKQSLETRIRTFVDTQESDEFIKATYNLKDKPAWSLSKSREKLRNDPDWEKSFVRILYRPFDERWIFYHPSIIERGRNEVMSHLINNDNLALITNRTIKTNNVNHVFVTNLINDLHILETANASAYTFPLYRYHHSLSPKLWNSQDSQGIIELGPVKEININSKLFSFLEAQFDYKLSAEQIFYYIYAILHSTTYREMYREFLQSDFPRIPFTKDYRLFQNLAQGGEQLVQLHLLKSKDLDNIKTKFYRNGSNEIKMRKFILADQVGPEFDFPRLDYEIKANGIKFKKRSIVVINNQNQYFGPINEDVWNYQIGGYQVLDKWLKDRTNKTLSAEDIKHYCKIATVIARTIEIQKEIDRLYPKVEESLIIHKEI